MARTCSTMALCFVYILAYYAFFNQCLRPLRCAQNIMDISGIGIQISLCLTWLMFRTAACDEFGGCTWDDGATLLLLAQLFYFGASLLTRCMREPRYKRKEQNEEPKQEDNKKAAQDAEKKAVVEEQIAKEQEAGNKVEAEDAGDKA